MSTALAEIGVHHGLPVLFGVLTCNTLEQAIARWAARPARREKTRPRAASATRGATPPGGIGNGGPDEETSVTRRTRAREIALQFIFQDDLDAQTRPEDGESLSRRRLRSPELLEFSRSLVAGVRRHRAELDKRLEKTAANWSLHRMAATDRNVLRLGAYEILYGDTPARVAVNEAVELAKRSAPPSRPSSSTGFSIT